MFTRLNVPMDIYQRIFALTAKAEGEISGLGRTTVEKKDFYYNITVEEMQVFNQVCHESHTSLKEEDLSDMYYKAAKKYMDKETIYGPETWNFWWHSHVNMAVFFSKIDTGTLEKHTKDGGSMVAFCINKRGDVVSCMYENGKEIKSTVRVCIIPVANLKEYNQALSEAEEEVKQKVTKDISFKGYDPEDLYIREKKSFTKHYDQQMDNYYYVNGRKVFYE